MSVEREPVTGLTPEAAQLVETYFARVHGALLVAAAEESEDAVDELRIHILEQLAETAGTPAEVSRVLAGLGTPEALAAEYSDTDEDGAAPVKLSERDTVRLHGRVMGMPYDVRVPDSNRIASRMWNPLDPRIFVPRIWGLGWDINFGALAVKLNLVRPDDEDEPFAAVPERAIAATVALPTAIALGLIVLVALNYASLPAQIPSHWDIAGRPDNFWGREGGVAFLLLMGVGPALYALSVHTRRRPALNRVAASGFALLLCTIGLSQFVQVLAYVEGSATMAPTFVGIALGLLMPFAMFVTMSRLGRAAEQRRDLEGTTGEGN